MTRFFPFLTGILLCLLTLQSFAQNYRLTGLRRNTFNTSWALFDSSTFVYSNGRGGDFDDYYYQRSKYDTTWRIVWNGSSYVTAGKKVKVFDQQHRESDEYSLDNVGNNILHQLRTYDLNSNNTYWLRQKWVNNAWQDEYRTYYTFDGNNNLIISDEQYWDTTNSVWRLNYKSQFDYDMNGNRTRFVRLKYDQVTSLYDSIERVTYHYTNNLCDTSWTKYFSGNADLYKYVSVYQNGVAIRSNYYRWSGTWMDVSRGFMFYQGSNNTFVGDSNQVYSTFLADWRTTSTSTYTLNTSDLPVTVLRRQYNTQSSTLENYTRDTMAYNMDAIKIWEKRLDWDGNSATFLPGTNSFENFYYYEAFTSNVEKPMFKPSEIALFPSPARDNINVDASFTHIEDFKVQIFDMQGRLVLQYGEKPVKNYHRNIPLAGLAAGNYILRIIGTQTIAEAKFTVIE